MAVTESLIPIEHPNIDATSPIIAVKMPIQIIATTKQSQPENNIIIKNTNNYLLV